MKQTTCHITSLCISYEWTTINWSILYLHKACGLRFFLPIPSSGEGEMHPPPQLQLIPSKGKTFVSQFIIFLCIGDFCEIFFHCCFTGRATNWPVLGDLRHACGHIELLQQCLQRQWPYTTIWPSQALGLTSAQILAKLGCSYRWLRIFVALSSQITLKFNTLNITATGFVRTSVFLKHPAATSASKSIQNQFRPPSSSTWAWPSGDLQLRKVLQSYHCRTFSQLCKVQSVQSAVPSENMKCIWNTW